MLLIRSAALAIPSQSLSTTPAVAAHRRARFPARVL